MKAISTTLRYLCGAQRQQSLTDRDQRYDTHRHNARESSSRRQRESDCAQEIRPGHGRETERGSCNDVEEEGVRWCGAV